MKKFLALIVIVSVAFEFVSSTAVQTRESFLSKFWPTTCNLFLCKDTLSRCVTFGCFGESQCRICVEQLAVQFDCKVCANEIYREAQSINGLSYKTIYCDPSIELHRIACSFYCRGLFKIYSQCSIISDFPVCKCYS